MKKNYDAQLFNAVFTNWDKQVGLIDDNGNPVNQMLSAQDNKAVFDVFVSEWTSFKNKTENKNCVEDGITRIIMPSAEDYQDFNIFLQETEKVVRYGYKNKSKYKKNIDNLIGTFGSDKLVFFLD